MTKVVRRPAPGGAERGADDGHAFGPAFFAGMDRTIRYFDQQLGVRRG